MDNKRIKKLLIDLSYPLFVTLIILLAWQIAALTLNVDVILPSPVNAFKQLFDYLGEKDFWLSLGGTLLRSLISFVFSFLIALLFAVLSAINKTAKKIISPFAAIIRSVPTMSVILLLIIWLSPLVAPLAVAVIIICPTLYSAFYGAIDSVDKDLLMMSRVYGVSHKDIIKKLYLPNMAKSMFENTASGFSLNIKLVIAAEALAQTAKSIGKLMQFAKINYEPTKLFALTLASIIVSVALESFIRYLGKISIRWEND